MKPLGIPCMILVLLVSQTSAQRQVQTGRVLDANPLVGSGGYNNVPRNYASNSNMYDITRSRGLSGFQGNAPTISNQLSVGATTSGVSTFRQQSVSLQDVTSNRGSLYRPQAYIYNDPLRTSLNVRDVVQSAEENRIPTPGASQALPAAGLANELFVDATAKYEPIMANTPRPETTGPITGLTPMAYQQRQQNIMQAVESQRLARRGGEDLFGVLRVQDRAELARQLRDLSETDESEEQADTGDVSLRARVDGEIDTAVRPEPPAPLDSPVPNISDSLAQRPGEEGSRLADPRLPQMPRPGQQAILPSRDALPQANRDAFVDLLMALRNRKEMIRQQRIAEAEDRRSEPPMDAEDEDSDMPPAHTSMPRNSRLVNFNASRQIVIRDLAGQADNAFNRYMQRAKTALSAGRFYQAKRQYELAMISRPGNPLAHLGLSLSTFAAGEWFTSAENLDAALSLFPPLMETEVQIQSMLPPQAVDRSLGDLEQWIQDAGGSPKLHLLAAFMYHNAGQQKDAQRHARAIREAKFSGDIAKTYAEYILTGQIPEGGPDSRATAPSDTTKSRTITDALRDIED